MVVPFDLSCAPPVIQSLVNEVLRQYFDIFFVVYIHDILIYSRTENQRMERLRMMLDKIRKHTLYNKLSKCEFLRSNLTHLGHNISSEGRDRLGRRPLI
jgi:hypothetical protein